MTTLTAALLFLGTCLAAFGTLAFLAAVPADPDPTGTNRYSAPDAETLRLTWLAALYGRRFAAPGLLLWAVAHPTTPAPYTLLLLAAVAAITASFFTTRAAPEMIRRAAAWSP